MRDQRADLRRMHEAIERRNATIRELEGKVRWALKLTRQAREGWWREAERRHDTARKNASLAERVSKAEADRAPWNAPSLRVHFPPKSRRTVHVAATGRCAVCGGTDEKLTNHHVFGRTTPLVVRACRPCHEGFHRELVRQQPGEHVAAMTRAVADAFAAREAVSA